MSSGEEEYGDKTAPGDASRSKTRKIQRACDICRRKKIRCDGAQIPGNTCSNCTTCNYECTYVEAAKKRGPPKGYVEGLENRLEKMQKVLSRLCSDRDFPKELGGVKNWLQSMDVTVPMRSIVSIEPPPTSLLHTFRSSTMDEGLVFQDSDTELDPLDIILGDASGAQSSISDRFLKFSNVSELRDVSTGSESPPRKSLIGSTPARYLDSHVDDIDKAEPYQFPEHDLMMHLFDIYFTYINIFMPLLHRPTFERAIANGFHFKNSSFGAVVLMVCATSSRYSNDPRVVSPGLPEHSVGWKWFSQVRMSQRAMVASPSLYDLQMAVTFLQGAVAGYATWTTVGFGVRLVQNVSANQRRMYTKNLTVECELWKRVVWSLVVYDRIYSNNLGRPCAMQDEDFDIDFPIECDDEYLEQSELENTCKQPPGKPSTLTFFVTYLKLNQILAFGLRTVVGFFGLRLSMSF